MHSDQSSSRQSQKTQPDTDLIGWGKNRCKAQKGQTIQQAVQWGCTEGNKVFETTTGGRERMEI